MIKRLIEEYSPLVKAPNDLCACSILWAIYDCERYSKGNRVPRFEPAYALAGVYFKTSKHVREAYAKWGYWAACSYSNFQIMFITAQELGYTGPPLALDHDSVAIPYVTRYLNKRVFDKGASTVEEVADAYNSGTYLDSNVPEKYIRKFVKQYDWHKERECKDLTNNLEDSSSDPQTLAAE